MTELAERVRSLSVSRWGADKSLEMVGTSQAYVELQRKLAKVARYREPVLITGEAGVGKEQLAEAIYLLSESYSRPYISVNCPQYQEGNLTVSELFGHVKGSFTGAVGDHPGAFEEADGGTIFLDEIGDLPSNAQAMLLRALATGEFRPLGANRSRRIDVRVISATNRPLNQLVMTNQFRYDLFSRLARFQLDVPPLRDRADDWLLLVDHSLARLGSKYGVRKQMSASSLRLLETYPWPGNVRQLISVVTTGYAMADGETIEPVDFATVLDRDATAPLAPTPDSPDALYHRLVRRGEPFWEIVYEAFMDRNLNRAQVREVIRKGLDEADRNYRNVLTLFGMPATDYQRFMDFLRHHDLKP
ncbi:MAG TPA: sigma 54-interacting transcriptional regulator [Vicinamibacterales bacterium]|nr:sigma 54-interacting transcriptional regulator [Vicinamibacterales bacterium]